MSDIHAHYLVDLGQHLREAGEQTKRDLTSAPTEFQRGRMMAYYEVLSLMYEQAKAFGLPLSDVSLEGLDPDRWYLGRP
jgi:hypothetical protein